MQFQERLLEDVVGFDDTRREPQAEPIEARREQLIQLLEDTVVAASVTFHQ